MDAMNEDDPTKRRMTKNSIVMDGLFSGDDIKGEDDRVETVAGGLFDDSDDEKEQAKAKANDSRSKPIVP